MIRGLGETIEIMRMQADIDRLKASNEAAYDRGYRPVCFKKLHPDAQIPKAAHGPEEDAGFDLFAVEHVVLTPDVPQAVATGIAIELPSGLEAQIRPRSGLALKHGVTVANAPGTVDPSYRGEIKVILLWNGHAGNGFIEEPCGNGEMRDVYRIHPGDRIAQMVIARYEKVEWSEVDELGASERGASGFGSTGK